MRAIRYKRPQRGTVEEIVPSSKYYGNAAFAIRELVLFLCESARFKHQERRRYNPEPLTPELLAARFMNDDAAYFKPDETIDPMDAVYPIQDLVKYLSLCDTKLIDFFRVGKSDNSVSALEKYMESGIVYDMKVPLVHLLRAYGEMSKMLLKRYDAEDLSFAQDELIYALIASLYATFDPSFSMCFAMHEMHDLLTSDKAVFECAPFINARARQSGRKRITLDSLWLDSNVMDPAVHGLWQVFMHNNKEAARKISDAGYGLSAPLQTRTLDGADVKPWMGMMSALDSANGYASARVANLSISEEASMLALDAISLLEEPNVPEIGALTAMLLVHMGCDTLSPDNVIGQWLEFVKWARFTSFLPYEARRSLTCTDTLTTMRVSSDRELIDMMVDVAVVGAAADDPGHERDYVGTALAISALTAQAVRRGCLKRIDEYHVGVSDFMAWSGGEMSYMSSAIDSVPSGFAHLIGRKQDALVRRWLEGNADHVRKTLGLADGARITIDAARAKEILRWGKDEPVSSPLDIRTFHSRAGWLVEVELDYEPTYEAYALFLADALSGGAIRRAPDDIMDAAARAMLVPSFGECQWPGASSISKDPSEAPYFAIAELGAAEILHPVPFDEGEDGTMPEAHRPVYEAKADLEDLEDEGAGIEERLRARMALLIAVEDLEGVSFKHDARNTANFPFADDGEHASDDVYETEKAKEGKPGDVGQMPSAFRIDETRPAPGDGKAVGGAEAGGASESVGDATGPIDLVNDGDDGTFQSKKRRTDAARELAAIRRRQKKDRSGDGKRTETQPPLFKPIDGKAEGRTQQDHGRMFNAISTDDWSPESILKMRTLCAFSTDLTALAAFEGVGDNVLCRDDVIDEMVTVLARRDKSNPVLLAPAGTGKTAIVEGLAKRIVSGEIPMLRDKRILSFDVLGVIGKSPTMAGAAETVKKAMSEAVEAGVILFVDEIHMLGGDIGRDSTIANALKPMLSRSGCKLIGATTEKEYNATLGMDKALQRRFTPMHVPPLDFASIVSVVDGKRGEYGEYHDVEVPESLSTEIALLASAYLGSRPSPDRELDVVDVACSLAQRAGKDAVSEADVVSAVRTLSSNRDVKTRSEMARDAVKDDQALLDMFPSIAGQRTARLEVGRAILSSQLGVASGDRPRSVMLFAGPSGVGKSEMARAAAKAIGLDPSADVLALSMSEYVSEADYTKLLGTGPQWVGYKDGGALTNFISAHPSGIIVLDEFDMCHEKMTNLFMGIFDTGRVRNGVGDHIDCRRNIFICTTNVGFRDVKKRVSVGFASSADDGAADLERAREALKDKFGVAMMSRFDTVVLFDELSKEDKVEACRIQRDGYAETVKGRFEMSLEDIAPWEETRKRIEALIDDLGDADSDVRTLWGLVEKELNRQVLEAIVAQSASSGDRDASSGDESAGAKRKTGTEAEDGGAQDDDRSE